MISIKEYAKQHKVAERTARKRLDRQVSLGLFERKKGEGNAFLYYEKKVSDGVRWHDPFNRCRAEFNSFNGDKWPLMPRQQLILHLCNIGLQSIAPLRIHSFPIKGRLVFFKRQGNHGAFLTQHPPTWFWLYVVR